MSAWKSGTLLAGDDGSRFWVVEVTANTTAAATKGRAWQPGSSAVDADGNGWRIDSIDNARPLVVIDPESVEDVERLTCLLAGRPITRGYGSSDVQAALREFADPKPRIEEPTGLGAVVADADGHKWTRANSQGEWFCECGDEVFTTWDEFTTATEVLSEGVTP